jgi:single-stranded DNA-binding protein
MNICIIGGRIVRDALVKGTDRKVVRFTVETRDGRDEGENKEYVNRVPCVLFNPASEIERTLIHQGEGLKVELQGRVASWGENHSTTGAEVVVFNRSLVILED